MLQNFRKLFHITDSGLIKGQFNIAKQFNYVIKIIVTTIDSNKKVNNFLCKVYLMIPNLSYRLSRMQGILAFIEQNSHHLKLKD